MADNELARRNDGTIKGRSGLSEKQKDFVSHITSGKTATEAARLAGYAEPGQEGWRLKNTPSVKAAILNVIEGDIQTDIVVLAARVHKELLESPETPPSVKGQMIKLAYDKAGIGENSKDIKEIAGKALAEMTREELQSIAFGGGEKPQNSPTTIDVTPDKPTESTT